MSNGLRIGVDVDDVLHQWYKRAHNAVAREYASSGGFPMPKTWHPYQEYGISRAEWEGILRDAVIDGSLHSGEPIPGTVEAIRRLRRYVANGTLPSGTKILAVTARGETFSENAGPEWLGALVREQTHQWFARHGFEFDDVMFTADKTTARLDYLVDDNVHNVDACLMAGTTAYLMHRTWNEDAEGHDGLRVLDLGEYVTRLVRHWSDLRDLRSLDTEGS